ncbi:Aldo-keto reductase family 1 member [Wickerhamomyces ciferrii]|uniref:Aldo-keto reductase family 1 member n=1 Tax=Wickerhamomyces ciferrii (strain ATCC 14091 / BCRC 22168 / CBS 111 / JCM 3599 / NBRC 0793 / NRRL Y-1031 F-60-10) TaxID=1206466 RepID=K0KI41_WICCF|nr:Aldo-keto reductase family 1 member [Wickerhamomyces ciferrii]CCH42681.1 Aldo-keto reductase family 1 member [Wickerhamomyces ciferrii]
MPGQVLATSYKVKLNDGNEIPALGLGGAAPESDHERFKDALKAAIRSGIRHIDTAWYYNTEHIIGAALKELIDAGEIKREDLFITTKVWPSLWDKAEYSLDQSLKDLQTDYVDLFLQHWPITYRKSETGIPPNPTDSNGVLQFDTEADYLDTYKQLIKLRDNTKKVKSIGVSNFTEKHLQRAIDETGVVPAVEQVELHPRLPQKKLVEFAESKGIKVEAFSPAGSSGAPLIKEPLVVKLSEKYEVSPNSVLNSYHILSGRIVLPRSSNAERVKTFIELAPLTEDELKELDQLGIDNPKRFINDDWGVPLGFEHWKTKFSWES